MKTKSFIRENNLAGGQIASIASIFACTVLLLSESRGAAPPCLIGSGCEALSQTAIAHPGGVPLALIGLFYHTLVLWGFGTSRPSGRMLLGGLLPVGVLVSAGLTFYALFVVRAFCPWCSLSAAATLVQAWAFTGEAPSRAIGGRSVAGLAALAAGAGFGVSRLGPAPLDLRALRAMPSEVLSPNESRVRGSAKAKRTVVVFADVTCPGCRAAYPGWKRMAEGGRTRIVYRHFPNRAHRGALEACQRLASVAPADFWRVADAAYAAPDPVAYLRKRIAAQDASAVSRDLGAARELRIAQTPLMIEVAPEKRYLPDPPHN
ncbi:hypothetical protein EON79_13500 [bacterium]|nr:MAG: hypothetical protein EON79_13500 [bacterium]